MSKKNTTRFRIIYANGERTLRLTARCEDIDVSLLHKAHGDVLLVSPIANEMKLSNLHDAPSFNHVILDLQGFLRVFDDDGETRITRVDSQKVPDSFLLKMNREELHALTGTPDLSASIAALANSHRRSTVTLGDQGAILIEPDSVKLIRPITSKVTEPTGLGDIFTGALAVGWARTGNLMHAAKLGVAAASVSRGEGVAKIPSKDDVIAQMEKVNVTSLG
jgi:sugar/nucleoside kinase (ribokinase family)